MDKLIYFKTLAILLACLALALPANAYDFVKDGIYYNINGNGTSVSVNSQLGGVYNELRIPELYRTSQYHPA